MMMVYLMNELMNEWMDKLKYNELCRCDDGGENRIKRNKTKQKKI